ncbi:hypothetical protein ON010_g3637 [Phytophthora cinnamomi]|nr:hypothetical protein ON010_g3637 [Phytophthora cinnamomi]
MDRWGIPSVSRCLGIGGKLDLASTSFWLIPLHHTTIAPECAAEGIALSSTPWANSGDTLEKTYMERFTLVLWNVEPIRRDTASRTNDPLERFNRLETVAVADSYGDSSDEEDDYTIRADPRSIKWSRQQPASRLLAGD